MTQADARWIEDWQLSDDEWAQLTRPERGDHDGRTDDD